MTWIVATLGPSSLDDQNLQFLNKNVSILRINGSWVEEHQINSLRSKTNLPLLMDIPGNRGKINKKRTSKFNDDELIEIAKEKGFNFLGLSYVDNSQQVSDFRKKINDNRIKIVAKIETKEALDNLDEICREGDLILIDRGDLGTAIGYQNVPAVQEKIIQTAHKWHKEVIVATEMLMSSINSDKPSCADVSDVYFALLQGADYVMLSEETALGEPKVAVSIMKEIILSFENRKTVFTYGAFDILHPGHIRLLKRASKLGDKLIVGLVSDESVRELKGATRPAMSLEDRMELISAIRYVDEVYVMDSYDPVPLMKNLNINILTKGNDWDIIPGQEYAARMGIKIVKLSYSKHFSTSKLFEKIASFKNDDSSVNDVPEHQRVKDILATSKK